MMPRRKPWSLSGLRVPVLIGLATTLVLFLTCIAVLYGFAKKNDLYQSPFLYEIDMSTSIRPLSGVSPFSVLLPFFASIIGLWWDSVQQPLCALQPFITMTQQKGTKYSQGVGLHYCPKNWTRTLWSAWTNKHWLLYSTILGSILCQIRELIDRLFPNQTLTSCS